MVEIQADLSVGKTILVFDRTMGKNMQPREAVVTRMGRTLVTAKDTHNRMWTFYIASQATKSGFQSFRTVQQHQYHQARIAALKNIRAHMSSGLPDLHLFAVSKLLTELDGVVAECTDAKAEEV